MGLVVVSVSKVVIEGYVLTTHETGDMTCTYSFLESLELQGVVVMVSNKPSTIYRLTDQSTLIPLDPPIPLTSGTFPLTLFFRQPQHDIYLEDHPRLSFADKFRGLDSLIVN